MTKNITAQEIFDKSCNIEHPLEYSERVTVYYTNAIQAMEEYSKELLLEAIKEIEEKHLYWKNHGNYYVCGGLNEAIEILKSKIK